MDIAELGLVVDSTGVVRATKDLNALEKQGARTEKAASNLSREVARNQKHMASASRSFQVGSGSIAQLGYQVQDISVQLGAGQSPFLVLAQQGSQIASIFGPGGAVAGAVLAIGGVLAGSLLPSLFDSGDASEELEKTLQKLESTVNKTKGGVFALSEELINLANTSKAAAAVQLQGGVLDAKEVYSSAIKEMTSSIKEFDVTLDAVGYRGRGIRKNFYELAEVYGISKDELNLLHQLTKEFNENPTAATAKKITDKVEQLSVANNSTSDSFTRLASNISRANANLVEADDRVGTLTEKLGELNSGGTLQSEGQLRAVSSLLSSLKTELDSLKKSDLRIDIEFAKGNNATEEDLQRIRTLHQAISAQKEKLEIDRQTERQNKQTKDSYDRVISSLEVQIAATSLSGRELAIYNAQARLSANATEDMRNQVAELAGTLYDEQQALINRNQALKQVRGIIQRASTAQERYLELLWKIDDAEDEGAISAEEAAKARQQAWEETVKKTEEKTDEMSEYSKQAARNAQSHFADFLFDPFDKGLDGMLKGFIDTIRRMLSEAAAAKIFEAIGLGGGGGGSGGLGDIFSTIAASFFADGGVMTSQGPVPLRAYADGGVANSPQMAIFGEGSTPEAYVPLPDGRSIPVTVNLPQNSEQGQATGNIAIYIDGIAAQPDTDTTNGNERQIIIAEAVQQARQAVASDAVRGGNDISSAFESAYGLDRSIGARR